MRRNNRRRNLVTFLIAFFCLCMVGESTVISSYARSLEREQTAWNRQLEHETDRAFTYLEQPLRAGVRAGNNIFSATWYMHYRNVASAYAEEFDGLKRLEVIKTLAGQVYSLPLIENILVVSPSMDSVISKEGWLTMDMWEQIYPFLSIDSVSGFRAAPTIAVNDDEHCVMVLQDSTPRREKSVVCLVLSKTDVGDAFGKMLGERATHAQVTLDGQTLVCYGEKQPGNVVLSRKATGMRFDVEIAYKSYNQSGRRSTDFTYLTLATATLCVAGLLAMLLTRILTKPINEMILRFGGEQSDFDDPYRFIYAYVDDFARKSARLSQENDSLRCARRHFLSLMRNEIILGMLTNAEFNFDGEYIRFGFPWMSKGNPFLMAACMKKQTEVGDVPDVIKTDVGIIEPAEHYLKECANSCYASIDGQGWYIYWFSDAKSLERGRELLEARMQSMIYAISPPLNRLEEMHGAYRRLREQLERGKHRWLTLPTAVQGKLLSRIYAGKREDCAQLIAMACETYNPDAVLWLLIQVAGDCGFDASDYMLRYRSLQEEGDGEALCALLTEFAKAQCRFQTADRPSVAAETAAEICRFIDAHYRNPEMSVNYLADQFSMHRTLISKAVKSHTGETFSDYVQKLRMEEAARLIREGQMNFQQISEQIGMLSYSTFVRAFVNTYGCSPSEWSKT